MRHARQQMMWIQRPQLILAFVVACLCAGGAAALARPAPSPHLQPPAPPPPVITRPVSGIDCRVERCLALTFDDGPSPTITPHLLDVLAREQIKATFFVVGAHVPGNEALLRRQYQEGHEIGNHSWGHPDLSKLSPEEVTAELQRTQQVVAAAGVPAPHLLRPPYGAINDMVASHNNLAVVRWNVDPEDWKIKDPAKIAEHILSHVRPGAIILLHDMYPATIAALETSLPILKAHYRFVTVSQLLNLSPGDQGQYFGRP